MKTVTELTEDEKRILSAAGAIQNRLRRSHRGGPKKKQHPCKWCGAQCLGRDEAEAHRRSCEKRPLFSSDLPGIGIQCCKWCGRDGMSKPALACHLRICNRRHCVYCGVGGLDRAAWREHNKTCEARPTRKYVRTMPYPPKRPPAPPNVSPEALAAYRDGMTMREVEQKFGVPNQHIRRAYYWPDPPPPRRGSRSSPASRRFETWQGHFLSKVDISGGPWACWPWRGRISGGGYGIFSDSRLARSATASRIALEAKLGRPLGEGMFACHTCDNPPCCNPKHLFEGTNEDNIADCVRKGRTSFSSYTKLDAQQVKQLRLLSEAGVTRQELAQRFGVSLSHVGRIVNGERRKSAEAA